jgi:predicted DNA-binding transcriptional regulator YafY
MRSDKLGYNAPIIVKDKKYYIYEDKNYSISKTIFNDKNIEKIKESLEILKQFGDFALLEGVGDAILKLDNQLTNKLKNPTEKERKKYIQFENNQLLKGLEHLMPLYNATSQQKTLKIMYQSFNAIKRGNPPQESIFYPYLLKEFRNRWFLIGKEKHKNGISTFALDRIVAFEVLPKEQFFDTDIDFEEYYNNLVGVTKTLEQATEKVILEIQKDNALYILTKPIHHSQRVLQEFEDSILISLDVVLNFELEKEILSLSDVLKVVSPNILVRNIKKKLKKGRAFYENETYD